MLIIIIISTDTQGHIYTLCIHINTVLTTDIKCDKCNMSVTGQVKKNTFICCVRRPPSRRPSPVCCHVPAGVVRAVSLSEFSFQAEVCARNL